VSRSADELSPGVERVPWDEDAPLGRHWDPFDPDESFDRSPDPRTGSEFRDQESAPDLRDEEMGGDYPESRSAP
jgi:hypothetical protein